MLIVLDKSFVAEHLRYLKSGKSVKVQAHYTKRVKKHTEHAPPHNYNLDHLSEKDRDLFNRMHAEQHVAHFYDGHALRKRVAHHEGEAQKHNDHADQLDKDGKHKEAAAARRKADKHIAEMHRHKTELRKVDNAVHGLAAMKEKLVAGSGTLDGDAEAIHQHYVSKVGERLKPASKPAAPLVVLNSPKDGDRNADGLVFRNGRWHRDDSVSDGMAANSADNSALVDYAKEMAGKADSKRRFFDAVIGRFSSEDTSNEHRQALFDALGVPKGAKVDDFRAALDSYYDANKGERKKRHLNDKQALAESNVRKVMQQAKEVYQQDRAQFESETDTSPSHADDKAEAQKQAQELAEMKQEAPASVAANPSPSAKPETPKAPLVVVAKPEAPKPNAAALAAAKAAFEKSKGQTRVTVSSGGGSNFDSFEDWVSDMYDQHLGLMSPEDKAEAFKAYQAAKKAAESEKGTKSEKAVLSEAAAAAKLNAVSKGGVALKGTPKQREWAEKIRQQRLSAMTPEQVAIAVDPNGLFVNAKWWIETRDMDARQLGGFFEAQKKMLALARKQQAENAASAYAETVKIYNGLTGQFGFGRAERGKDYLKMAREHLAKFPT